MSVQAAAPWYVSSFGADYLTRYAHRCDESAAQEIPFVCKALKLSESALVLDLCCGDGRHARGLQQCGLLVLGLDLSAELLQAAIRNQPPASRIRYMRGDMRRLPLIDSSVDGAVNLFTSFGYFDDDAENAHVLDEVARVLKPGAPFVFDFFNLKPTVAALVAESERTIGPVKIIEKRRFSRGRLEKQTKIVAGSIAETRLESVRGYEYSELVALFEMAGLAVDATYGDLQGSAYDEQRSPRCVLRAHATKRGRGR